MKFIRNFCYIQNGNTYLYLGTGVIDEKLRFRQIPFYFKAKLTQRLIPFNFKGSFKPFNDKVVYRLIKSEIGADIALKIGFRLHDGIEGYWFMTNLSNRHLKQLGLITSPMNRAVIDSTTK